MAAGTKRKHSLVQDDDLNAQPTTHANPLDPSAGAPRRSHRPPSPTDDTSAQLARIAQSDRTAFEKRVWTALCQVPRGRYSTYGILAAHLGSSPRAVGNALRRNPFAPGVPCHRILATGGGLGGFKGQRPKNGEGTTLDEKRALLRGEGVRFDRDGKLVLGTPFEDFDVAA
ncbi:hypothetical protein P8C59_006283 [Phyllachora maydis]|uniref:Methylated-DNA--protein-cysteine methyltransferase n=1 Tax=Phyllachora maydis TaxID=1825666 RepID=A0AAD9MD39_9PEZI|nr:hypothetical protein P8C59_006283 [Phyllachora maydis]